ncbi:MAG: CCA tRNA nucleotidyltransferase [Anaerolineae bacterium]
MTPELIPRTPQRPLRWPEAVLDLQEHLADHTEPVVIVGGAVRDAYRGVPIHDVDLAVPTSGIRVARKIADRMGGSFFMLDKDRDVGRVILETPEGKLWIDVARYRGDDLLADLTDRDFTVNAMAVNLLSDLNLLIDPLNGEQDLLQPAIRRCSPHAIADDPIRMLRAVRHSIQLTARIEPQTLADIRAHVPQLAETSPERIRDELIKLMRVNRPAAALRVADALGLLPVIVPEVNALHGLQQRPPHVFDAWNHTLMVVERLNGLLTTISPLRTDSTAAAFDYGMVVTALDVFRKALQAHIDEPLPPNHSVWWLLLMGALLHDLGKGNADDDGYETASAKIAERVAVDLRLSNPEKQRLTIMAQHHNVIFNLPAALTDLDMHRFWYQFGRSGIDLCLLALADYLGTWGNELKQDAWLRLLEQVQTLLTAYFKRYDAVVVPPTLVTGNDLMDALNLSPGKHIGAMLDHIREGQVTGDITTVEDAIAAARTLLD